MNVVFMGTPDFAVPCLKALSESEHNVRGVFTQPDKPKNRGQKLMFTPVKECAVGLNIPVFQPLSLRKGEDAEKSLDALRELNPDCIVVAAYGQILPKEILDLPKYGCINVHASLLPMYRGAAPIQHCIINGEKKSGVTIMYMAEGLDTGDMILKEEVEIDERMTASQLHDRLCEIGAPLLLRALEQLENGTAVREPQNGETCYASMISKEMCRIDFHKSASAVYNFIRGMSASPCAFTTLGGKRVKIFFAEKTDLKTDLPAGTAVDDALAIACGDGGAVRISELQPEGGKRMSTADYLRGKKVEKGTVFGE